MSKKHNLLETFQKTFWFGDCMFSIWKVDLHESRLPHVLPNPVSIGWPEYRVWTKTTKLRQNRQPPNFAMETDICLPKTDTVS